ncbi:bifunctional GNAT domain/Acyl-CoA N-acyltransferase [Babesia duncani]|uniref:Bifunctional GNAT domain/Acyl-CoA N-acyltransferase n=1 Tax=Babesia duncani TaxID=323732 RepID=A0AAD9UQ31_9APIC|nr:bifunctional GNAT domain/Acyl-CoA N-acyltransferase [Babesia duncani]
MQNVLNGKSNHITALPSILAGKPKFVREFKAKGLDLLLKPLESYEEYEIVRPLVEGLSRCPVFHTQEYVEAMLSLPTYFPFIILLKKDVLNPELPLEECRIVGFFEIYMLPHMGRFPDSRLERFVVSPDYHNRGIGQGMLELAIKFCKSHLGCNRIDLIAKNSIAIHIYKKFGFSEITESKMFRIYFK